MSPRLVSLWFAAGLATSAFAFDLGGLSKALGNADKLKKGLDTAKDATKLFSGLGPEEERSLGDTVALEIIGRFGGLVRDEAVMRRLNLIGGALARYSARPDHPWRFGLLNSDTVNAFSAPDGYVFITRGLYQIVADDDQLAAILGHEMAHITGRDALRIIETGEKGSVLMKQVAMRSGNTREAEAYLNQVGLNTEKIVKFLVERGYSHPTEFAADHTGHDLAATTGYAPGGLRAVLLRLQQIPAGPQKVFSTHPPLTERIKRLSAEAPAVRPGQSVAPAEKSGLTAAAPADAVEKPASPEVDDDDRAFAEAAEKKPAKKKR
ncbi:MAG: M48 family metalloprotease [Opitutaceae bacterium]|nr:M48 family metalloprotease [Opitutaceae bacterium]